MIGQFLFLRYSVENLSIAVTGCLYVCLSEVIIEQCFIYLSWNHCKILFMTFLFSNFYVCAFLRLFSATPNKKCLHLICLMAGYQL